MPRPKKDGAPEPKRRSRTGCWPCKARKVKCGEEKPQCLNCERQGEACDYSIRLNWGGRAKKADSFVLETPSGSQSPNAPDLVFPSPEAFTGRPSPSPTAGGFIRQSPNPTATATGPRHVRSTSNLSLPPIDADMVDPDLNSVNASPTLPRPAAFLGVEEGFAPPSLRSITSAPAVVRSTASRPFSDYPQPRQPLADYTLAPMESAAFDRNHGTMHPDPQPLMPPPFRASFSLPSPHMFTEEPSTVADHRNKRVKLGPELNPMPPSPLPYDSPLEAASSAMSINEARSPNMMTLPNPFNPFATAPMTPGSSSASDELTTRTTARSTSITSTQAPPDLRRLSVSSLLQDSHTEITYPYKRHSIEDNRPRRRRYPISSSIERTTTYGFDLGAPDLDTPKNDDDNAIMIFSPPATRENTLNDSRRPSAADSDFGDPDYFSRSREMAFEPGGYYAQPVKIKISQALEPLPPTLLENRMNLLYFHHFLNHTARILVVHECEQNPFRNILPEMAVDDEDLLNLLLAYSACHRARLLCHPEPSNRVAMYVKDVFPKLRHALENPESISIKTLATAIMLSSLEILSPSAFGVNIPWRHHLSIARQMLVARGGPQAVHKKDKVSYFLSRWFAYLDVLGSLSGRKNDKPLSSSYWADDDESAEDEFQIDCLTGFTSRCTRTLARIAELAKQCEPGRLDEEGNVDENWQPPQDVVLQALQLQHDLKEGREHVYSDGAGPSCPHRSPASQTSHPADPSSGHGYDNLEITATNELYHWAGQIHLLRRVLNRPASNPDVQTAVREIVVGLYKIRHGSTAEACLLFPMFTAGCDAMDQGSRDKIMSRLRALEHFGMTQVQKARTLMQRVWDTGQPWESLVTDEFFG